MAKKGSVKYRTRTVTKYRTRSKARKHKGGARRNKSFTLNAGNVAAGGALFLMAGGDKVAARAIALAQKQATLTQTLVGAAQDVYSSSKQNVAGIIAIPVGLSVAKKIIGRTPSVAVPFTGGKLRIRGL